MDKFKCDYKKLMDNVEKIVSKEQMEKIKEIIKENSDD